MKIFILFVMTTTFFFVMTANGTSNKLYPKYSPSSNYQTINTKNFEIIFDIQLFDLARFMASHIEQSRIDILNLCECDFEQRTTVFLSNESDLNKTYTSAFPKNFIYIGASLPSHNLGLHDYTNWYLWVFSHEYSHIIHLNAVDESKLYLRNIFGNWYRPNMLRSAWSKEGIAVLFESLLNSKGRINSTTYRMFSRTFIIENHSLPETALIDLPSASNFEDNTWPWTFRPYVVGAEIFAELYERNGFDRKKFFKTAFQNSNSFFDPLDTDILQNNGISSSTELIQIVTAKMKKRALNEQREIENLPVTKLNYLTNDGYFSYSPILLSEEDSLIYTIENPQEIAIKKISDLSSSQPKVETIIHRSSGSQISISKSNRFIAFDEVLLKDKLKLVSKASIYDLKNRSIVIENDEIKASEIDIHPNGKELIFISNSNGKNLLIRSTSSFKNLKVIFNPNSWEKLSHPRFSPNGDKILFSKHNDINGGEDIYILDSEGRVLDTIANGKFNGTASWFESNDEILFSSDRTGVFNIYSYSLVDQKINQLSNVYGGLQYPVSSKDRRTIFATSYTSKGWNLVSFLPEVKIVANVLTNDSHNSRPTREILQNEKPLENGSAYRPRISATPDFMHPFFFLRPETAQTGLVLGFSDALMLNSFETILRYDSFSKNILGNAAWIEHMPNFSYSIDISKDIIFGSSTTALIKDKIQLSVLLPAPKQEFIDNFKLGASLQAVDDKNATPYFGFSFGSLLDKEFRPTGYMRSSEGYFFDFDLNYLRDSNSAKEQWLFLLKSKYHYPLSLDLIFHLEIDGGLNISKGTVLQSFQLGGMHSFPYYGSSDLVLLGYPFAKFLAEDGIVFDLSLEKLLRAENRFLFNSPIFLGKTFLSPKFQLGYFKNDENAFLATSVGIEIGKHLVTKSIFDLQASCAYFRGDSKFGGEDSFYLFIRALD